MLFGGFIGTIASSLGLEEKEKEDPDPLTTAIKRGIYYLDTGHHDLCDTTLHEALELARSASNEKAIDYIYVILADNAMAMRELTKAEALYKETLRRILASNAKEDDESVIEISLQLATIYAERKEYENAEEGFAFCIQKQKNRIKDIDIDKDLTEEQINSLALYGMILDWYSKYCQMRKNYKLAADYTRQALRLSRKTLGELHEQTLVLMSDLAVITEQNGDLDKAIEILKEVVQRASSINAEGLSTFFYNLGMCYMKKNDGHNAFYCCTRATRYADKLGRKDKVFNNARNCMVKSRRLMIEDQLAQED